MPSKLILIGGMSRAGKSLLAKELSSRLPGSIHFDQDDFTKPESQIPKVDNRVDWEDPKSINWVKLNSQVEKALRLGKIVIVEGIFAFSDRWTLDRSIVKIYLSINKNKFLERRKKEKRWGNEPDWYLEHVWKAHQKYHNPFNTEFDIRQEYNEQLADSVISMLS